MWQLMSYYREPPVNEDKPEKLVDEILKMDRLLYLSIIEKKKSLSSLQMTREVLALKKGISPKDVSDKEIARNNPNINKRLKDLADREILIDKGGKYSLSLMGFLIIDELTKLSSNIEVFRKYRWFFNTHDYTVIPRQELREIHRLQLAEECQDAIEYVRTIENSILEARNGICIATEHLHDIPNWIIQELEEGTLFLKLIYQFREPFGINYDDEDEIKLWRSLAEKTLPRAEFRYLTLEYRNPMGIRIIDGNWAIFNLFEMAEEKLNRSRSFYGKHEQFVTWVESIFTNLWIKSKPLDIQEVSGNI
jgi:predicted transcriptional regulator